MRMGQGVRTGLGHGGITCVLQTQFYSFFVTIKKKKLSLMNTTLICTCFRTFICGKNNRIIFIQH